MKKKEDQTQNVDDESVSLRNQSAGINANFVASGVQFADLIANLEIKYLK